MRHSLRGQLLTVLVYLCVVLLLLSLAAFARSFSTQTAGARLSGRYSPFPLFRSQRLEELTLSWNGFALRFSRRSAPRLERVDVRTGEASILFEGDTRLTVSELPASQGSLLVTLVAPPGGEKNRMLSARYTVAGIARLGEGASGLAWERDGKSFSIALPSGARIDAARRIVELPVQGAAGSLRIVFSEAKAASPAASSPSPLPDESALASPEELKAAIARFLDSAYKGWSESRLFAGDGLWRMPDGTRGFAEGIGTGLLAESLARGSYADRLALWSDALERHLRLDQAAAIDYETSPYTGAVREYLRRRLERERTEIARIRDRLARSDAGLLSLPGIVPFVLDSADRAMAQQLFAFMVGVNLSGLDASSSVGLLESLLDYAGEAGESEICLSRCREVIEKNILPAARKTDTGIFFSQGSGGRIDVRESLRCGSLLVRAGSLLDTPRFAAAGRGLVVSALGLAGDAGSLPATLLISSARISSQEGALGAESVYRYLPVDRRIPREIPLFRQIGPGSWIWTAAEVSAAEGSPQETRLVLSFPAGQPHHFILRGIRPFAELRLHGIPWHADPSYARYSDGWAYDAAARTLLMKLTGRKDSEEIIIRY